VDPAGAGTFSWKSDSPKFVDCPARRDLDLPSDAILSVCVEEDGMPTPGAEVNLMLARQPDFEDVANKTTFLPASPPPALTDEDGCTSFSPPRGLWRASTIGSVGEIVEIDGTETTNRIVLERETASTLTLEVTRATAAVEGVIVKLEERESGLTVSTAGTDLRGRVRIRVPPGSFRLRADLAGRTYRVDPGTLTVVAGEDIEQDLQILGGDESLVKVCVTTDGLPRADAELIVVDVPKGQKFHPSLSVDRSLMTALLDTDGCADIPEISGAVVFARDVQTHMNSGEARLGRVEAISLALPGSVHKRIVFDDPVSEPFDLIIMVERGDSWRVRVPLGATRFTLDVPPRGTARIMGCGSVNRCIFAEVVDAGDSPSEIHASWKPAPMYNGFVAQRDDPWISISSNKVGFFASDKIGEDGSFSLRAPLGAPALVVRSAGGDAAAVALPGNAVPGEVVQLGEVRVLGGKRTSDFLKSLAPESPE
jgi:hypothetical protein